MKSWGGAARSTVLLANSTGADFAQAGAIATDVMAQFNIKASDMAAAVDQITGVTVASKFDVNDYALALAQAGGVAGSVGVEFDDFNATIAATSPSFASGSDAGTSFKTFLQRLVPTTDKAKIALIDLGLSTGEDVVTAFFAADGAMRPMEEIAENLQNAFAGLSEAQKIEAASTIFGTDAMRTALALAEGGGEIIQEMKNIIGNTSAEESAATRMDSLRGSWEIFQGVVETLTLGIGDKFIPVVRSVVDWLTALGQTHGPMVIDMFGVFAQRIADFIPLLGNMSVLFEDGSGLLMEFLKVMGVGEGTAQRIGQAVWDFKETVEAFLTPIATAINQLFDWQDVLMAVGAVILSIAVPAVVGFIAAAAPVIAVFAGLVAASALLRAAWTGDWQGISDFVNKSLPAFIDTLRKWGKAAWEWLMDAIPPAMNAIREWSTRLFDWIETNAPLWLKKLGDWGTAAWQWIVMATTTTVTKLGEWGAALWRWVTDNAPKWEARLSVWGRAAWEWIANVVPTVLSKLGDWGSAIFRWIADNLPNFIRMVLEWGVALYTWIGNVIPNAINALAEFIRGIREKGESEGTPTFVKMATEWAQKLWKWITEDLIPAVGPAFMDFITTMATFGVKLAQALGSLGTELALLLWQWIVAATPPALQKLAEWGAALWGWIQSNMPSWVAKLTQWGKAAWEWIVEASAPALAKLREWAQQLWGWVLDNAPAWAAKLLQWGKALWQWIVEMTPVALEKLREFGVKLINWVGEKLPEWAQRFLQAGRDIVQGLWNGLKEKWSDLTSWFGGVWNDLVGRFKNFFGISSPSTLFAGFGRDMMAGLQGGIESASQLPINAMNSLSTQVQSKVSGMVDSVANSAKTIRDQINNMPALPDGYWSTPPDPTAPTTPGGGGTTPTTPSTPPPTSMPPVVPDWLKNQQDAIALGARKLGVSIGNISGEIFHNALGDYVATDVVGFSDELKLFIKDITDTISLYNLAPMGTAQEQAVQTLQSGGVFEAKVDDVLSAIQTLIRSLSERGVGNQFLIQSRPDEDLHAKYELIQLVDYLNALYG